MFCSLLRCHLPELPLSGSGRRGGGETGYFDGFKFKLSCDNFSNEISSSFRGYFLLPSVAGQLFCFRERL